MARVPGLTTAIEAAVDAACGARLRDEGYRTFDGVEFTRSGLASLLGGHSGEADPLVHDVSQFARVRIFYPSGATDCVHGPGCALVGWARDLFAQTRREVEEAFERFTDLPDPGAILRPVVGMGAATTGLAVGGPTTAGGGGEVDEGNPDMAVYVAGVTQALAGMTSVALDTLMTSYLNRMSWVLNGQHVLGAVALYGIGGEAEVWTRAREDVVTIATTAEEAFAARARSHDDVGGAAVALTVAGAAVAIGGVATGPAAVLTTLVGAGLTIAGTLLAAVPAPPPPPPMGGGSYAEILGHLHETLSSLNVAIAYEEHGLADMMRAALGAAVDELDQFSLGVPGEFLAIDSSADAARGPGGEVITLDVSRLRSAAPRMGALASMTARICDDLETSWGGDAHAWRRPGSVGMGATGHHAETDRLVHVTARLVRQTSHSMREIAEQLLLIAHDFETTEAATAAELQGLVVALADPTPRTDVEYGYDERT